MIPLCEENKKQNSQIEEIISKQHITTLYEAISEKGVFTLSDNVSNYDEIRIYATNNVWDNYLICNIYKHHLNNTYYQTVQYAFNGVYDGGLKIYDNKIDTNSCEKIGTENCHIFKIEGIKY